MKVTFNYRKMGRLWKSREWRKFWFESAKENFNLKRIKCLCAGGGEGGRGERVGGFENKHFGWTAKPNLEHANRGVALSLSFNVRKCLDWLHFLFKNSLPLRPPPLATSGQDQATNCEFALKLCYAILHCLNTDRQIFLDCTIFHEIWIFDPNSGSIKRKTVRFHCWAPNSHTHTWFL